VDNSNYHRLVVDNSNYHRLVVDNSNYHRLEVVNLLHVLYMSCQYFPNDEVNF